MRRVLGLRIGGLLGCLTVGEGVERVSMILAVWMAVWVMRLIIEMMSWTMPLALSVLM